MTTESSETLTKPEAGALLPPATGSATWRNRPPADLAANLCHWLHNHDRIRAMTNAELVRECLGTEAADWDVVNEMMTRLHPGWENEPDESPNVLLSDSRP
jgi:hypothetical protein